MLLQMQTDLGFGSGGSKWEQNQRVEPQATALRPASWNGFAEEEAMVPVVLEPQSSVPEGRWAD